MTAQSAFRDLPPEAFPFEIIYLNAKTGDELGREKVDGPGVVTVPAYARIFGVPIRVRVEYANGTVQESGPEDT